MPVKTVGEAIENVPAKLFKESDVWVKTKTPVLVLRTDNEIPNTNNTEKLPFEKVSRAVSSLVTNTKAGIKQGDFESMSITTNGKGIKIDKDGVHSVGRKLNAQR